MNFFSSSVPKPPKVKTAAVKGASVREQYIDRCWIELQKLDPSITRKQFLWVVAESRDVVDRDVRRLKSGQVTMDELVAEELKNI